MGPSPSPDSFQKTSPLPKQVPNDLRLHRRNGSAILPTPLVSLPPAPWTSGLGMVDQVRYTLPNQPAGTMARLPWEVLLLVGLVGTLYFSRLGAIPLRGEETRWARVAWEMRESGDYIVPRQQGQVFPDRPPLNSWFMLLASRFTGQLDRISVRLPAALATVLTSLAVWAYCRQFLTRWGAGAAALVYATFGQVVQLGRFAESDALFICFLTSALLVWHSGYLRSWPKLWTWTASYLLAALAGLTKGPQGPLYFMGTVWLFLLLGRDLRYLFSTGHAAGFAVFVAVVSFWQVPFSRLAGTAASAAIWSEQGYLTTRLWNIFGPKFPGHFARYPVEVLANLLPWSVLLIWFISRRSREAIGSAMPYVRFLVTFLAVAFPTCWVLPGTRPRHVMSLYPAVACLIGVVLDRCAFCRAGGEWDRGFRHFLAGMGFAAAGVGVAALLAAISPNLPLLTPLLPPTGLTAFYAIGMLALAAICVWASRGVGAWRAWVGVVGVAAVVGLSFGTVGISHLARIADTVESEVAQLKSSELAGQRLVSFGPLFHRFVFHWQDPIEILPWPTSPLPAQTPWRYFAFMKDPQGSMPVLPFAWQEVATVYCDRARERGLNHVVIGRRMVEKSSRSQAPSVGCACDPTNRELGLGH